MPWRNASTSRAMRSPGLRASPKRISISVTTLSATDAAATRLWRRTSDGEERRMWKLTMLVSRR